MPDNGIQAFKPTGGALSAESYQTYELAKENDAVLGGDNIAQIRSYAAYARAQAQAIHKTIAATSGIEDVTAIKQEALETEQTFAKVGIYADQRIGEILRELPKGRGNQYQQSADVGVPTKAQAEREAHIDHHTSIDLQAMAANPDVVQAVLDKAEQEGRIPSRKQVLDAIHDRKIAEMERDNANDALAEAYRTSELMEAQIASLQKQVSEKPKPEVVEKTIEVESQAARKRISELEHERDLYLDNVQKLRKRNEDMRSELDKAKDMLGMDKTLQDVRKDVQYLTSATNQYVRQYGGLTWTAASLEQVDAQSLAELRTAAINLATFANALVASLESFNG